MILILAPSADETVAAVVPKLERHGAHLRRLDLAELPTRVQVSWWCSETGRAEPRLHLAVPDAAAAARAIAGRAPC